MAGISKVEICNYALQEVGDNSIITLDDLQGNATLAAQQCNLRYDQCRRAALEMHPWNFALKRVSLPLDADAPVFDFAYKFTLPSDLIRVVGTETELDQSPMYSPEFNGFKTYSFKNAFQGKDRYKIEGGKLLYDENVCKILYVFDQQEVTTFSSLFVEVLSLLLAARISYKLTGDKTLQATLEEKALKVYMREAQVSDAQQGTQERSETSRYIASRS